VKPLELSVGNRLLGKSALFFGERLGQRRASSLKPRSLVIFPEAFHSYAQMGGKADQSGFETLRSWRPKQKTDNQPENQNRDRNYNQAGNERGKHGSNCR
jgi:hypothetical protein